ncbi:MAG: Ribosome-associated ATPase [Planctomycetes bacterium]|nr:Ribosome-associated ATPase [Planctomycetota bacterium]
MSERVVVNTVVEPVVQTAGLTVRFGKKTVLDRLDAAFDEGTVTAILGRNGTGKSTLLRVLTGFLPATAGGARIFGMDCWSRGHDVRRLTGYVPDRMELPRWMTVEDHFRFLEPFYPTWDRAEEARLVRELDLDRTARVRDLSKGQREKHLLAAALAHRPELLLLDEPFSGLDPVARKQILAAVIGHLRDEGRTILVVTHSMVDVERMADRIVLLDEGRVRLDRDAESLRRGLRRVALRASPAAAWTPPGAPRVERSGDEFVLAYTDWTDAYGRSLAADPAVSDIRTLPSGLEDVYAAAGTRAAPDASPSAEEVPCAAS